MLTFRQVSKDEWQRGDYRTTATIHRSSSEILQKFQVVFEEYEEEGMGRMQGALFLLSNGKQFTIIEYLEPSPTITEIFSLNDYDIMTNDLEDILEAIELSCSELDWVNPAVNFQPHYLWQQDEHGNKSLIEKFLCRADAKRALQRFERPLHKQTYWITERKEDAHC